MVKTYSEYELTRTMDRAKSQVFVGKNAAFLGSLMCSMEFIWAKDIQTAQTDGIRLWVNPDWFMDLPELTRMTVIVHELWHPALIHPLRVGSRDHKIWNIACDIHINNRLGKEGYSFQGTNPCIDQKYGDMTEEDIYDELMKNASPPPPSNAWSNAPAPPGASKDEGDIVPLNQGEQKEMMNNVMQAAQVATQAGQLPGAVRDTLSSFFSSVVPWETLLDKFFTDMLEDEYTWARPNRRYQEIYLPSKFTDDGRLEHLMYYLDTSGSITNDDVKRFNSEVKHIKEKYNPEKLTLVQFDTVIRDVQVFEADDPFDKVVVVGRGGTSFRDVREHITKNHPTAAIIFSDMECAPMHPLDFDIPIIWVAVRSHVKSVDFGELIHIRG